LRERCREKRAKSRNWARSRQIAAGANALSAAFYPTPYRATGVAWANGIGRSGSILGSLLGGILLGFGWLATTVYALVAIPAAIAAAGMLYRRSQFVVQEDRGAAVALH
jgi:hypothetical protein